MSRPRSATSLPAGLLELSPRSPFRPPDWRHRAAGLIHDHGLRLRRNWIDVWIRRCLSFLRRADRLGALSHTKLSAYDPELAGAFAIHLGGNSRGRLEVEACLLSGQGHTAIADRCRLATGVVMAFEAIFFNVSDRLAATDYILFRAIGPTLYNGTADEATIIKLLAYVGGPLVLDLALEATGGLACPQLAPPTPPEPVLIDEIRWLMALKRVPLTGRTAARLLRLERLRQDLERRTAARPVMASAPSGQRHPACPLTARIHALMTQIDARSGLVGPSQGESGSCLTATCAAPVPHAPAGGPLVAHSRPPEIAESRRFAI